MTILSKLSLPWILSIGAINLSAQSVIYESGGKVGIGTSTPANALDVKSTGTSTAIGLLTGSQAADALRLINADGSLRISNGTAVNLLNLVGGNVGVGTSAPGSLLELYKSLPSNSTLQPLLTLNADYASASSTGFGGSIVFRGRTAGNLMQDNAQIAAYNENIGDNGYALGFFTAPSAGSGLVQRFTILRGGNIGVGTSAPNARFEVLRDSSFTDYTTSALHISSATTPGKQIRAGYDSAIDAGYVQVAHTGISVKALILNPSGGNVGIGTTNPTQKLSVNGTVRAKEVVVETSGWADYVFSAGYQLEPLSGVEAKIKEQGHLPGIPSTQEVAEKGVGLGEMQAKLLAKVEELTLHAIKQEKRIEQLEAEVKRLRQ